MFTILIALAVFAVLILAHELGHFMVAKLVGIKVLEFSLGMGPAVWQRRKGDTMYSIRAIPIGGFNRMAGTEGEEEDDPRGFNKKTVLQRMAVIGAGSGMNFVLAFVLFLLIFMVLGLPSTEPAVGHVSAGSPAEMAGIHPGDRILAVNQAEVNNWRDLVQRIYGSPGIKLDLRLLRGDQVLDVQVVPQVDPQTQVGMIGIGPEWVRQGFWDSIVLGIRETVQITSLFIVSIVQMITGKVQAELAGPVGIVQMVGQAARYGLFNLLSFTGILSLNLAIINLFPIPALDGSRLVFLGFEGILGRAIDRRKENLIHLIGFALLIVLMVIITYQDLLKIFG